MAQINLVESQVDYSDGKDSVVIVTNLETIPGGKSLDTTGFGPTAIRAGHVIIKETATGEYKPMPLTTNDTVYGTLPAGHSYAGVLIASIPTDKPFAAVLMRGTVNPAATPYAMTSILAAVKTALPLILWRQDND